MIDLSTIPDDVLIARGQYSTLNSRARELRHRVRDQMVSLTDQARTVTRLLDGSGPDATENLSNLTSLINAAREAHEELTVLVEQMDTIQPAAWPKGKR